MYLPWGAKGGIVSIGVGGLVTPASLGAGYAFSNVPQARVHRVGTHGARNGVTGTIGAIVPYGANVVARESCVGRNDLQKTHRRA